MREKKTEIEMKGKKERGKEEGKEERRGRIEVGRKGEDALTCSWREGVRMRGRKR